MKLPLPFLNSKDDDSGYYLALLITDEKVTAVILHEYQGRIKIFNTHLVYFPASVETLSLDELITAVDKAISSAEEVLPPNIETHQTVFGVKETWVDNETKKIKKEHLNQLKKVCDNLDLTPIGFMVTTEAIINLLQQDEGAPLSAIFADIGRHTVALTLVRAGKPIEKVQGPIDGSAAATVDKLLRHFTIAVLPARIILLPGTADEKLSQQFITHQWSSGLPFIHVPQVTMLPAKFDARAVTYGAATQLGFELVSSSTTALPETIHTSMAVDTHTQEEPLEAQPEETDVTQEEINELPEEPTEPEDMPLVGDNFGFVSGVDVEKETPHHKPETHHAPIHHEETAHHPHRPHQEEHHADHAHPTHAVHHTEPIIHHRQLDEEESEQPERKTHKKGFAMPAFSMGALGKNKLLWIIGGVVILLLALGAALSYYYYNNVTAQVKLTLKPKMANQTTDVTFSATSPSDFSENVIAAQNITAEVNGDLSIDATGKKDVGEKAKGKVTIYNSSGDTEDLDSGTIIKSSNGLQFLLDKDVTISSASGDIFSGTKPGTTDVTVTAKDSGTESNLPSNTKFSIGSNNLLAAKNDSAFSGGSKKIVTVVSKDDLAKLRTQLPQSLEDQAIDALKKETDSGQVVLPAVLSTTLSKEKFDKKVDDEAKKVKLSATVQFSGLAYDEKELGQFTKSLIKKGNDENISIADDSVKNTVNDAKKKSAKEIEATVDLEAGLLPNINAPEVTKSLEGKSLSEAHSILGRLPQLDTSTISFSPHIPLLPNLFPTLPKQITVEISNE